MSDKIIQTFTPDQIEKRELQLDDVLKKMFLAQNLYSETQDELKEATEDEARLSAEILDMKSEIIKKTARLKEISGNKENLKSRKRYLETTLHNLQQLRRHMDVR